MATTSLARQLSSNVSKVSRSSASPWFSPHMAAASRAIAERIPLVDLVVEVRDARIPLSSECEQLRKYNSLSRRIVVLNKMELTSHSVTKEWISYFEQNSCVCYGVDSSNTKNIQQLFNFLQAQVRHMRKKDNSLMTTILLVGIPNVGKSALANSLHEIGRINAAEKGKLRHAKVSQDPGQTRDISSFKIGSHPNIYVLDSPGILPPDISDVEVFSKLALTGAIHDCLVGTKELAHYFLSILNSSDEYKKWSKLYHNDNGPNVLAHKFLVGCKTGMSKERQHASDPNQELMGYVVRRTLFETISSFDGNIDDGKALTRLIDEEITALRKAFRIRDHPRDDANHKVFAKLLNLYRIGKLGRYNLDCIP